MQKLELVRSFRMEQENEHLQAYKRMFPHVRPTCFQMDLIESTVKDAKAWEKTLIFWGANDYRPQSIGRMLDYYRQVKAGTVQTFENLEKVKMQVGVYQPTEEAPLPNCLTCSDTGEMAVDDPDSPIKIKWVPCPKCK